MDTGSIGNQEMSFQQRVGAKVKIFCVNAALTFGSIVAAEKISAFSHERIIATGGMPGVIHQSLVSTKGLISKTISESFADRVLITSEKISKTVAFIQSIDLCNFRLVDLWAAKLAGEAFVYPMRQSAPLFGADSSAVSWGHWANAGLSLFASNRTEKVKVALVSSVLSGAIGVVKSFIHR